MSIPVDAKLYSQIKKQIYKKYPKHSAYRSGHLVKTYKKSFKKKYGTKSPYKGKETRSSGLTRWFAEEWTNQRGEVGYKYKSDVYRPNIKISKKTPKTFRELGKSRLRKSRRIKYSKGRVYRF